MDPVDPTTLASEDSSNWWTRIRPPLLPILGLSIAVVVFAPVLVAQLLDLVTGGDQRPLEGVSLDDLEPVEVRFSNEEQDLELAGLLFTPDGPGPHPAAVLISGSGPGIRRNSWNLTVVDHLQRNGIAVLLPDKRGSEQSEGDWRTASFDDLATDVVAAVDYLIDDAEVDVESVGLVGMSQGGRIAPLAASQSSDVAWVVNMVGGVLPAHDQLRYEEIHNLRQIGFLPGVSDVLAPATAWLLINGTDATYWDAVGNFDPLPYWASLQRPGLIVYGSEDTNVPTSAGVRRLETLTNRNITVRVYKGSGHAVEDPPEEGNRLIRLDALDDITQFILQAGDRS